MADPGLEPTDDALVAAFQNGDSRAFDVLVGRWRRAVWGVCWGILRNREQAEEACQDAFVKAWNGLARFQGESSFKTWVFRIAMNASFDHRAREATQARARDEAAREGVRQADIDSRARGPRALDDLMHGEELDKLREAMQRLPERQRTTLLLKVQQDLKYTEISEILGCPVGTAKANFHHAVQNLRRYLKEAGLVPEDGAAGLSLGSAAPEEA